MSKTVGSSISISVITPCYNGARYLRDTIGSVLTQSRPALEMIVIDDGSTDESASTSDDEPSFERINVPLRRVIQLALIRILRRHGSSKKMAVEYAIYQCDELEKLMLDPEDGHKRELVVRNCVTGQEQVVVFVGF